jgi:hypothetical protein
MKRLGKQSKFIEQGKVAPMHPDYQFSNVGVMLLVDKMRSDKTNDALKHLLIADHIGPGRAFFTPRLFISVV